MAQTGIDNSSQAAPAAVTAPGGGRAWAGWLALLAVLLPPLAWRASLEESLWLDEIYTLMLVPHRVADLIALTGIDDHPPGYYLLLKGWLALGGAAPPFGGPPGIFWARLPGVAGWVLLAGAAWWLGRRMIGRAGGAPLLAWAAAGGAMTLYYVRELRGHALALPALFGCYALLLALWRAAGEGRLAGAGGRRRAALLWGAYALLAAAALWCHLLSAFVLLLLGLFWFGLAALERRPGSGFTLGGALAHAAAILAFTPWLWRVTHNLHHLEGARRAWMTPPTLVNYLRVFVNWYPLGPRGGDLAENGPLLVLGILSALAPLGLLAWALAHPARRPAEFNPWRLPAVSAGVLALLNVLLLWLVDRAGWVYLFHGPRYPMFTAPLWGVALAAAAGWAAWRQGWSAARAALALIPWFLCSLIGQAIDLDAEHSGGLRDALRRPEAAVAPGATLYVSPETMLPYTRAMLAGYRVRPARALAQVDAAAPGAILLRVNPWTMLEDERDRVLSAMAKGGALAAQTRVTPFPNTLAPYARYEAIHLIRPDAAALRALGARDFRAVPEPAAGALQAVAAPELRLSDGWSTVEANARGEAWRWTTAPRARLPLPAPLSPGAYRLELVLGRYGAFRGPTQLKVSLTDEAGAASAAVTVTLSGAESLVTIPLRLARPLQRPVLLVEHPVCPIRQVNKATQDPRSLGIFLRVARLFPAG